MRQATLAAGTATGKIVACQRGANGRVDKGFNVLPGGAAGMILYNPIKQDVETDNHWLPAIHLDGPSDRVARVHHGAHRRDGDVGAGQPRRRRRRDVMAAFSSRGPQATSSSRTSPRPASRSSPA